MFSYEFCDISKNAFFTENLRTTASAFSFSLQLYLNGALPTVFWKPQSLSRNINLRIPFRYIISFSAAQTFSVCFHLFILFTARSSHRSRGVRKKRYFKKFRKFNRKPPVSESLFNKFGGLTPILKNICQRLLLYCTRTTRCYLSVLLYIQHLQKQPLEVLCKKKVFLEISHSSR